MNTNGEAITLIDREIQSKISHAEWCAAQALNHEQQAAGYRQRESDAREQAAELRRAKEFL